MERILEKLNKLKERIDFVKANLSWKNEFLSNRILRKAIYKEFQECIEAVFDIVSIIAKKIGFEVEDDYSNLERVKQKVGLSDKAVFYLKKTKDLKDALLYEFDEIDDNAAYNSIKKFLPILEEFLEKAKEMKF